MITLRGRATYPSSFESKKGQIYNTTSFFPDGVRGCATVFIEDKDKAELIRLIDAGDKFSASVDLEYTVDIYGDRLVFKVASLKGVKNA